MNCALKSWEKLLTILTTMIINNYGDDDDEWLKLLSVAVDGVILPAAKIIVNDISQEKLVSYNLIQEIRLNTLTKSTFNACLMLSINENFLPFSLRSPNVLQDFLHHQALTTAVADFQWMCVYHKDVT